MSKQGELLHELVRSMNGAEKRHFMKFVQAKNVTEADNRYVVLFKELGAMRVFDEKKLNDKLHKLGFPSQIHRIQNYLYNLILRYLDHVDQGGGFHEVLRLYKYALLLLERGLTEQAEKVCKRATKLCKERSMHGLEFELLLLQRRIKNERFDFGKTMSIIDDLQESVGQMQLTTRYQRYDWQIFELYSTMGSPRSEDESEAYKKIYDRGIDSVNADQLYGRTKIGHDRLQFNYHYSIGDQEQSLYWQRKYVDSLIGQVELDNDLLKPTIALVQLITSLAEQMLFEEAVSRMNGYRLKISQLQESGNKKYYLHKVQQELTLCELYLSVFAYPIRGSELSLALAKAKEHEAELRDANTMAFTQYLGFASIGHIYLRESKVALKYLIELRDNRQFSNVSRSEQLLAVLMIICYAEMGKVDALAGLIDKLKRSKEGAALIVDTGILKALVHNTALALNSSSGEFKHTMRELTKASIDNLDKKYAFDTKQLIIDLRWYFNEVF